VTASVGRPNGGGGGAGSPFKSTTAIRSRTVRSVLQKRVKPNRQRQKDISNNELVLRLGLNVVFKWCSHYF